MVNIPMPMQTTSPTSPIGGLGDLGGFINSRRGGDVMQALGISLMGGPRNAPLQDFGQNLMALQDRTRGSQKEAAAQAQAAEQRQAMVSAAVAYGVPQDEAQALSANPQALKMRMDQIAGEQAAAQRNEFLSGLGTPGSFDMPAAPGGQAAAPQGGTDSWGALGAQYGWQAPTQGEATGDFIEPTQVAQAAPAPQVAPQQAAPQFSTQNPNAERLMQQRQQYVQRMMAAPDEASREVLENYIGQIDVMLKNYEPTSGIREYQFDQQQRAAQGLRPQSHSEWDAERADRRRAETNVTVNSGGKFEEEFAKSDGAALAEVSQAGMAAQRNLGRIDRLGQLLDTVPTGAGANFKQIAANYGLKLGADVDNIQAAQALINSLVPEQRPAGSGPMSDADLELFKQSLPRIVNQPGGNKIIISTMKAIAEYDAEGAMIVQQLRRGEIDRAQAFDALQSRQNPLASLNDVGSGTQAPASDANGTGIDAETQRLLDMYGD